MAFPKSSEIDNVLLQVLVDLGGHARPQDIYPRVAEFFPQLTSEDLETRLPSSVHTRKWWNAVQWAKQRLHDAQCVDGTPNKFEGEWEITPRGREVLQVNPPVRRSTITASTTSSTQETAHSSPLFSAKTFELLELLHAQPTKVFYKEHKDEFKTHLEIPLAKLFQQIANLLPSEMTEVLEMENRILARIPKNDYGQGGAWDFLWGAFYPKGGRRIEDGQLYITVNHEGIKYGFSVADYGKAARERFASNLKAIPPTLAAKLSESLDPCGVVYGEHDDGFSVAQPSVAAGQTKSLEEWIRNLSQYGPTAKTYLTKEQAVSVSAEELAGTIADLFKRLFPLFLMAKQEHQSAHAIGLEQSKAIAAPVEDTGDDDDTDIAPQANIERYNKSKAMDGLFLAETQFDEMLEALKEKKNVVLQGAPGVGKTFVAKRLAYALIESNDQRQVEVIQFHQSYSYEDFIQGFRPTPNGYFDLKYGIFYQFCRRAQRDEAERSLTYSSSTKSTAAT